MADTTVTGRIGDQEVQLVNAASEATLLKLLESMNRMGSPGGATRSSNDVVNENTNTIRANSKAAGSVTKALGSMTSAIISATSSLIGFAGSIVKSTLKGAKSLADELFFGGERVSDFTKHLENLPWLLGTVGGYFHKLASFIDQNVNVWRELSKVGASFNNNIFDMRRAAAGAGMNLDEFASLVQANATTMALFGNTITAGSQRFGKLSLDLRTRFGEQLFNMGFTVTDINESLLTYAEINARLGRQRVTSDRELIANAASFAMELDLAAKVTGINRKQLEQNILKQQQNAGLLSMQARMGEEQRKRSQANVAALTERFPQLSGAFIDLADGVAQTAEGRALRTLGGPELAKAVQDLMTGSVELGPGLTRLGELARAQGISMRFTKGQTDAFAKSLPEFNQMIVGITEMGTITEKSLEAAKAEQDRTETLTKFFSNFQDVIKRFRRSLEDMFLNSELFKTISRMYQEFIGKNPTGAFQTILNEIKFYFGEFLTWMNTFLLDVQSQGLSTAIQNRLQDLIIRLFDIDPMKITGDTLEKRWSEIFEILKTEAKTAITSFAREIGIGIVEGIKTLWANPDIKKAMVLGIGGLFAAILAGKFIGGLVGGAGRRIAMGGVATAATTGASGAAAGAGIAATTRGLAAGLAALANPLTLVGLGAVTLAIMGLAKAFQIASPGFESFGKLVKSTLEGAGTVVLKFGEGVGKILDSTGLALRNMGNAFKLVFDGISNVVGTVGKSVEAVLTSIFNGISNIIGKITEFKDSSIYATTDQIERISRIDPANLSLASEAVEKLKQALSGFAPGFLEGISLGLGNLFAPDNVKDIGKFAEMGPKLYQAAESFEKFKAAMVGFDLSPLNNITREQARAAKVLVDEMPDLSKTVNSFSVAAGNSQFKLAAENFKIFRESTQGFSLKEFTFTDNQIKNLIEGTSRIKTLSDNLVRVRTEFKNLDNTGIQKLRDGINALNEDFKDFNENFINKFLPSLEKSRSENQIGLLTDLGRKLDSLNTNVNSLIAIENESKGHLGTIAGKSNTGSVYRR